ncbi:prolyl oligopeptidase family serine peptidase [Pseudonocardia alaniniphila]|uniref:Prolyl oligopeptidase family serine peptidase n=1 Tax=Pseudonocardia alaniniphila TaxID=75291 RepID=A0ABS9TNH6_9PSEU|nr:prolyl oligopeptidase family serine peptidase [Pseudonocardia alaniniphila]MCH6170094.1 prolyl oligopeptidase family serine peptidase [Pseudonocardia alaniniphila]
METITGTAAGVPFTALPPTGATDGPAPLIVTWHMLDAPRTDAAFAAALPMSGVPAWRVHLGMPMCGARMVDGRVDAILELARKDALMAFLAPFVHQAADEFPAALVALRDQLPVDDEPIGILGGSLGGAVALEVLATRRAPITAVALVNPAVRIRSVIGLVHRDMAGSELEYPWTVESRTTADELDFVARAGDIAADTPLLLVSGELDHPALRTDAAALVDALHRRYADPDEVELRTVPGLAHPLADEPGLEPAPQLPTAKAVDEILTQWFLRQLTAK